MLLTALLLGRTFCFTPATENFVSRSNIAIMLAAACVGIFGAIIPVYRERFMNKEIRI